MEAVSYIILIGSTLLIVSVLTSYLALRVGAPLLLIFLGIGLMAGEDGIGQISFNDAGSAFLIGSMALAVILFESGFVQLSWARWIGRVSRLDDASGDTPAAGPTQGFSHVYCSSQKMLNLSFCVACSVSRMLAFWYVSLWWSRWSGSH